MTDRAQGNERGFIIVAVLWIIAALALLAAVFMRFSLVSAVATTVHEDRLRAEGLISAATELTAFQITAIDPSRKPKSRSGDIVLGSQTADAPRSPANAKRPARGAFSFRLGNATATVSYITEAARIDLNAAPKEAFVGLFKTFGARPDDAALYADRIIGWRTKGEVAGENKEATDYRVAGLRYNPRQAPFQNVAELWLVFGIPPVFKERILPFVTVYSGQADVDIANAAPEVIASAQNMTPERLDDALQQRASPQGGGTQGADPLGRPGAGGDPAPQRQASDNPKAFRLSMRITLETGRAVAAEVVVLIPEDGDDPYRILSWRDDFDGWRT